MRILACFFAFYYLLGTVLLPGGDFSILPKLPAMYENCKLTEDKVMGPVDFITDHLINIDGVFDSHGQGDEQRPHQNHNRVSTNSTLFVFNLAQYCQYLNSFIEVPGFSPNIQKPILDGISSDIFRPPCV